MNRDVLIRWLEQALSVRTGEKLFLTVETKLDQKQLFKAITKEINILKEIDPERGWSLKPFKIFKDSRYWVGVEKVASAPMVGFVKKLDGTMHRVELGHDSQRLRRLKLMKQDGYKLAQIEEIEGPLSDEEKRFIEGG